MGSAVITPSGERLYGMIPSVFIKDEETEFFGVVLSNTLMNMWQGLDLIVQGAKAGTDPITHKEVTGMKKHPGWTAILDPETCPEAWLPWCAAFYGVVLETHSTVTEQREQLKELPAQKRGGVEAMIKAAQRTLTGSKSVAVYERVEANAYRMLVTTKVKETPSETATENAILSQKPGGVKLTYTTGVPWLEATKAWNKVAGTVTWAKVKEGEV